MVLRVPCVGFGCKGERISSCRAGALTCPYTGVEWSTEQPLYARNCYSPINCDANLPIEQMPLAREHA